MDPETPEWLNEDFLATVLQGGKQEEPSIRVLKYTPSLAVAPGNNYLSHVYRVKIQYTIGESEEVQNLSLMVKAPFTKGIVTDMADRLDVFGLEGKVYTELLPTMQEKSNHVFGPRAYHCPLKAIVLADLKEEGYIMCDRLKQLDFHHCEIAVRTLARFHATSIACYHDNPELILYFKEKMFVEGKASKEEFGTWLFTSVRKAGACIAEIEGCKTMGDYVISRAEEMLDSTVDRLKSKETGLNVLNHGDFWTNNMMFKYNESGTVEDVKLIDYQVAKYTTPVIDLLNLIWTSAREDVLERRQDLFNIYRHTLNSNLADLECEETLSEEELMDDVKLSTDWVVYIISCVLPHVLADPENVLNLEDVSEDDFKDASKLEASFSKVYNGKYYKAVLPTLMKYFSALLPI